MGTNQRVVIDEHGTSEISAIILQKLKRDAGVFLGEEIHVGSSDGAGVLQRRATASNQDTGRISRLGRPQL